mmetsp:Transcript_24714/g.35372  ORF Transcript_24714/g.35372 Transcript_24714/m.35372 type:complete len:183 (-) Transcript_24714:48-596(-)
MVHANKNVVTTDSSTAAKPTKTYQHAVYPFLANSRECKGYPPSYVKNEPKNELNFFLTNESDQIQGGEVGKTKRKGIFKKMSSCIFRKKRKQNVYTKPKPENGLACSLVSRKEISFEQLENRVSSSQLDTIFDTKPVIIICHGAMSWRNQVLLINLSSELLTCLDAHILRFDFTGNGHSKGV